MCEIKSAVFVQRYYQDINKRIAAALPIVWEPNQDLNILNALKKINEVMQNFGCCLKEAFKKLYPKTLLEIS